MYRVFSFFGWRPRTRQHIPIAMVVLGFLIAFGLSRTTTPTQDVARGELVVDSDEAGSRMERVRARLQAHVDSLAADTANGPDR